MRISPRRSFIVFHAVEFDLSFWNCKRVEMPPITDVTNTTVVAMNFLRSGFSVKKKARIIPESSHQSIDNAIKVIADRRARP